MPIVDTRTVIKSSIEIGDKVVRHTDATKFINVGDILTVHSMSNQTISFREVEGCYGICRFKKVPKFTPAHGQIVECQCGDKTWVERRYVGMDGSFYIVSLKDRMQYDWFANIRPRVLTTVKVGALTYSVTKHVAQEVIKLIGNAKGARAK